MQERFVLAFDVAKGKSVGALISSYGEVLISPYQINHTLNDFNNLHERIKSFGIDDSIDIILESTGIYHMPILRFFNDLNYHIFIINPLYGKNFKNNLRKTKTDKLDCLKLAELFFSKNFRPYIKPDQYYLNLRSMSRTYFSLIDSSVRLKNEFRNIIYEVFPEYELIFKGAAIFSPTSLALIKKYPHADILANTRVDAIANVMFNINNRNKNFYLKKASLIKDFASNSYPSVSKDDQTVNRLLVNIDLLNTHLALIDNFRISLINEAKKSFLFDAISSINGIGDITAALIIAELGDICRFNNIKQLTAYCGLDPSIIQSGKSINFNGPISKAGNKYVRHILFNTVSNIIALSAKCFPDDDIALYYRKKRNEGKHHYAAIVACSTKLLRKIFYKCKSAFSDK